MALLRAVVTMNKRSGLPEDAVQNVWHFSVLDTSDETKHAEITSRLAGFYQSFDEHLSRSFKADSQAHKIKYYDVVEGGAGPGDDFTGSPVGEGAFQTPSIDFATQNIPSEIAVCLSLEGNNADEREELGNARPAARFRGRLFLGPWNIDVAAEEPLTQRAYVSSAVITKILDAAEVLSDALIAQGVNWVIYSRANAASYPVYRVWVDDAFDVQRRRGEAAKTRTVRELIAVP